MITFQEALQGVLAGLPFLLFMVPYTIIWLRSYKADMKNYRADVQDLRADMKDMKADIKDIRSDMKEMDAKFEQRWLDSNKRIDETNQRIDARLDDLYCELIRSRGGNPRPRRAKAGTEEGAT